MFYLVRHEEWERHAEKYANSGIVILVTGQHLYLWTTYPSEQDIIYIILQLTILQWTG